MWYTLHICIMFNYRKYLWEVMTYVYTLHICIIFIYQEMYASDWEKMEEVSPDVSALHVWTWRIYATLKTQYLVYNWLGIYEIWNEKYLLPIRELINKFKRLHQHNLFQPVLIFRKKWSENQSIWPWKLILYKIKYIYFKSNLEWFCDLLWSCFTWNYQFLELSIHSWAIHRKNRKMEKVLIYYKRYILEPKEDFFIQNSILQFLNQLPKFMKNWNLYPGNSMKNYPSK